MAEALIPFLVSDCSARIFCDVTHLQHFAISVECCSRAYGFPPKNRVAEPLSQRVNSMDSKVVNMSDLQLSIFL